MRYLRAFFAMLAAASCLCVGCGKQQETFKGLVLKAASDVTVSLNSGFKDGAEIAPSEVVEKGSETYYYYAGLSGAYRYTVSGSGYYSVTKSIVVTEEQNQKETLVDVTPGKLVNTGWEAKKVGIIADTLLQGALSDDIAQWPQYAEVFTTPHYTMEHGDHQMTTQAQLEQFLQALDGDKDALYLYSAGTSSTYMQDIPIAVLTKADLSAAANLEQAAQAMGTDKPTVLIRAQMHGNEPAGGEAALAMIKWLKEKPQLLDKVNVCIIPRQNPDGAQDYIRTVKGGIDPNRDCLRLESNEIAGFAQACRWLQPAVVVDSHEYTAKNGEDTMIAGDVQVQTGYTVENTDTFRDMNLALAKSIFTAMGENGLYSQYYSGCASARSTSISGGYSSKQGSLYILLESRGIGSGMANFSRRVISHFVSMEAIVQFTADNAGSIMDIVADQRRTIIEQGSKYDPRNVVGLEVNSQKEPSLQMTVQWLDQVTGAVTDKVQEPISYTKVDRSRIAPTAYVIPAGEGFAEKVLELMDKQGIAYTFIPKGSTVQLQQYTENGEIYLSGETAVTFPDGAYVFCRNQIGGWLLSMLMEPDVDIEAKYKGTLVQQELIRATDGKYPLYRYIRDLNTDGFIDYR